MSLTTSNTKWISRKRKKVSLINLPPLHELKHYCINKMDNKFILLFPTANQGKSIFTLRTGSSAVISILPHAVLGQSTPWSNVKAVKKNRN